MDLRERIFFDHLSHAYVVEGDHSETLPAMRELVAHFGISATTNPDYHEVLHDVFTVDDARELTRTQGLLGGEGKKKIFIIAIRTISHESQNALLKTIEEPTAHTHFFFLVRSSAILLPTVRSRIQLISNERLQKKNEPTLADTFLSATIPERLKMIASMTKAKADAVAA